MTSYRSRMSLPTAALTAISTHVTNEHRERAQQWIEQEQPWPTTS